MPDNNVTYFALSTVYRACRQHGIRHSTFGRRAIGDPSLIADMRRGRRLGSRTKRRILDFIASLGGEA